MNAQSSQSAQLRARDETTGLFSPYRLGELDLANRVVMAPMTRSRAVAGNVPNPLAATYYAQRASAGLIVTEATQVSLQGVGYIRTPGIHSAEQVAGWKKVTGAVHHAGGRIFLQLWHVGRISHPDFHGGELPVAPSAISPGVEVFTFEGLKPTVTPRALELAEIAGIVEQFYKGAQNAKLADFDGVEIHGANGYLLDQFTRDGANRRTDTYGGSIANRVRLPLEVTRAVIDVWGGARRLSDFTHEPVQWHVRQRSGRDVFLSDRGAERARYRLSARGRSGRGTQARVANPAREVRQHLRGERRF